MRAHILIVASFLSLLGDALSQVAVPWFTYQLTGSATATAAVVLAGQVPQILMGLIGGALIDRSDAARVSLACDGLNFVAVLAIPVLYGAGMLGALTLAGLVALSQLLDAPGQLAKSVMLSALIDRTPHRRERLNGLRALADNIADLAGPALAGGLIAAIGAVQTLALDAASFLAAGVLTVWARTRAAAAPARPATGVLAGWNWVISHAELRRLALTGLCVNAAALPLMTVILPVLAQSGGTSAATLGLWLSAIALGATGSSLTYAVLGTRLRLAGVVRGSLAVQVGALAVAVWGFGASDWAGWNWAPVIVLALYGYGLGFGAALDATLLQRATPAGRRGGAMAAFTALRFLAVPPALLIAGGVIEWAGGAAAIAISLAWAAAALAAWDYGGPVRR